MANNCYQIDGGLNRSEIEEGLRAELEGQPGMLARVISGGEIRVGDAIEVMK